MKKGELKPCIRLVLEGRLSELVPMTAATGIDESGLKIRDVERTAIEIFGPGQIFGHHAVCAGLPDNQFACATASCEVAHLEIEKLVVNRRIQHFFTDEEAEADIWHFPGISEEELPGFLKSLAHNLWNQCLSMQYTNMVASKETTFNLETDLMMEKVRSSAIRQFNLPSHEQCEHVHRCEVYDISGTAVAERVIFLTNYVIFDSKMLGDDVKTSEKFVYDLEEVTNASLAIPDITSISFTVGGEEFEARCGNQPGAEDLLIRLEGIIHAKHVLLRRLEKESRAQPDSNNNFEPAMTPLLDPMPQSFLKHNQIIVKAGDKMHGITLLSKGSAMLMDGDRVVQVIKPGEVNCGAGDVSCQCANTW